MKAFWRIPKEWVQDWGLSWSEAGVLADMVSYPDATREERATRVGMTKPGLIKVLKRLQESKQSLLLLGKQSLLCEGKQSLPCDGKQSLQSGVNKVYQKRSTKFTKNGKQSLPPPTPPYIEDQEKIIEDITLDKSNVPNADALADKKTSPKKKKKYTDEEIKLHGELKAIFCEEWLKTHGEEFYWGPAAMSATIKIADQIKFYMPSEQKNDTEQLKFNFRFFVQKIFTSQDNWLRTNATPQVIASKFNEIYTSLKNGKSSSNAADNFHVFGSRNITPDILTEFT